jgi:hypothetical protein
MPALIIRRLADSNNPGYSLWIHKQENLKTAIFFHCGNLKVVIMSIENIYFQTSGKNLKI